MTTNAYSVIAAIDERRPGMKSGKQQLLLFFAQGHHLVWGGGPLFAEKMAATNRGVAAETSAGEDTTKITSEALLNTIGYVVTRYAALSPVDLRTLIEASQPWQNARKSDLSPYIDLDQLRNWFLRPDETDDPDDERPSRAEVADVEAYLASRTKT